MLVLSYEIIINVMNIIEGLYAVQKMMQEFWGVTCVRTLHVHVHVHVHVPTFVGHRLANKVFIGKIAGYQRGVWVIIG